MTKYEACIAQDVGCYGYIYFEADDTEAATEKAREMAGDAPLDSDWENSHSLRIVSITDNDGDGEIVAEDIGLDPDAPRWLSKADKQLLKAAPEMLALLKDAHDRLTSFIGTDCECDNTHEQNDTTCCLCQYVAAIAEAAEGASP